MKKLFTLFAAIALFFTLFLSSCALMNSDEFAQRKYYNFPRTNHTAEGVKEEHASVKAKQPEPVVSTVENEPVQKHEETITAVSEKASEEKNNTPVLTESEEASLPAEPARSDEKRSTPVINTDTESDTKELMERLPFFFLFILAIFLPFIAVYLHDNGRTNQWFWITLILCIFAVGALGFVNIAAVFGGLWFLAALIALLVIFDVL